MFEKYSTAVGPANIVGIDLHTIWDVQADETYDISHEFSKSTSQKIHKLGGKGLIALRTHSGTGTIWLDNDRTIKASKNTLLILRWDELLRYECTGKHWNFWWFEFTTFGVFQVPQDILMKIKAAPGEETLFKTAFEYLRKSSFSDRCVASVNVLSLLYSWFASADSDLKFHPHKDTIDKIIKMMYEKLNPPWPVSEMAETANMGIRNFRKVFQDTTGLTPKTFYQNLRLSMAQELLRHQQLSLTQIADKLGFSSPFHLSREFKNYFGLSPRQYKKSKAK